MPKPLTLLYVISVIFLFPFVSPSLATTATSQTQKIKRDYTNSPFSTNLLAEQNKQLSTIAHYAFPAIITIFSTEKESHKQNISSGFIISKNGYILTTHHVIKNSEKITIILQNNTLKKATLIGSDPKTNIALIKIQGEKIQGEKFPYLEFADSDHVKVGEFVIALGKSFSRKSFSGKPSIGTAFTTTVISSTTPFIQTNTTITTENSGGPLLNIYGEVIGITTQDNGVAIPINIAQSIITTLKTYGKVIPSYLGIKTQDLIPQIATAFGITKNQKGALITQILPNSPAEKSGLENGDIIIKFNNKPITSATLLHNIISLSPTNKSISISFLRGTTKEKRYVTLANIPPKQPSKSPPHNRINTLENSMKLSPLSHKKRRQLKLNKSTQGTIISSIIINGKAHNNGLQENDIILSINNIKTASPKIALQLIKQERKKKKDLVLLTYRNKSNHFIIIKP
jgi:serine protease Do